MVSVTIGAKITTFLLCLNGSAIYGFHTTCFSQKVKESLMATESPNSISSSSSKPESYSHWADPRIAHLWQAAHDKFAAGEPLAPPRMIPVVVRTLYDSILLKQIASLVKCPRVDHVKRLSSREEETGETVMVCVLSDEVMSRLDEYVGKPNEYLVNLGGKPRYAYRFRGYAQVLVCGRLLPE